MVFGMISPKIKTTKVNTPVPTPTATLPNRFVIRMVIREDAEMFTMLLPIKIALSSLLGFSTSFNTRAALRTLSSARFRKRILLTVVRAVSLDEKNADSRMRTIRAIMLIISPEVIAFVMPDVNDMIIASLGSKKITLL